jgi:isochorismate hydrolase
MPASPPNPTRPKGPEMAIPPIKGYPMPGRSELPPNTAPWRVAPARSMLLIHDMQRYFLQPFDTAAPGRALIANIVGLRDACDRLGIPVVYTAQPGGMDPAERGLLMDFWGAGMSSAPAAQHVVPELSPRATDVVLTKWRYSAFHRTELLELLRAAGRDQLIICGVYAHLGVLVTASDAFASDIQAFVVGDAVADFSRAHHIGALSYAAQRCGSVISIQTLLDDPSESLLTGTGSPRPTAPSSVDD